MKRALISVYNKEGIVEFAKVLESLGWEIISTGGTYQLLKKEGIKNLKKVEEITNFPEIMDGRVKTLHPKIHGGILADRSKKEHLKEAQENQIGMIDLVVCNLYPFSETISKPNVTEEEAIENIDIGGPSMLRAAAKNYQQVMVVVEPDDYREVLSQLEQGAMSSEQGAVELRRKFAQKAFEHTSRYDETISNYFSANKNLDLHFKKISDLRYGENPHQRGAWYRESGIPRFFSGQVNNNELGGVVQAEILHGKELSFNNILDADSALDLIREFNEPAAAVIKHNNPCGCAVADNINDAFFQAYQTDALSAFGGIIVLNRPCTREIAKEINNVFTEVVLAPNFIKEALAILKQKKSLRLLKLGELEDLKTTLRLRSGQARLKDYKKIIGGILEQDFDDKVITKDDLQFVTVAKPMDSQLKDLLFAWKVVKHTKSNAIVIAKDGVTVGIGAGQMSRVEAVDIAIKKGDKRVKGAVVASDGFLPFRDSLDKLAQVGVKSIIQPGGSIKDEEIIKAANEYSLSMVFTGTRAFKH